MIKKYILASINIYVLIFSSILYLIGLITINLYPKYITIIIISAFLISLIISIICYLNKHNTIYNTGVLLTIILNAIIIYKVVELNSQYEYLNNIITNKYEYNNYNVYVQKKNPKYNNLNKLNNKSIGMINHNSQNICIQLNNNISINCRFYNSIEELEIALQNGEIQSFILSPKETEILKKGTSEIKNQTRVIEEIKVKDAII